MLRIVVEIVPQGNETRKRTLGTMIIANDATGDKSTGNYDVFIRSHFGRTLRRRVEGWDRKRPFWALVQEALRIHQEGAK